ncbi:MAG: stimulus-sensing domain-containing protein [Pseudomonadota bacterium]
MALQSDITTRLSGWRSGFGRWYRRLEDLIVTARLPYKLPSVTWHIALLNLAGLIFLLIGILAVRSTEAWLIDAKRDSLGTQGQMIAAAIAGNASVSTGRLVVNPDELLLESGRALGDDPFGGLEFAIRPEGIAPIVKKLVQPTNTRARIYTDNGTLILDSEYLESQVQIQRRRLAAPGEADPSTETSIVDAVLGWFRPRDLPVYKDIGGANGKAYPEFLIALQGQASTMLVKNQRDQDMVTVVVPIQRMTRIIGVLMLATQGSEIDRLLRKERQSITLVAGVAAGAMFLLSLLLAATISLPLHRLSQATERVRSNLGSRESLPDYTHRADEIGMLSGTLREMTRALYRRLETSERFAADVAHELKNPLASVGGAAQLIEGAKTDEMRAQLSSLIQHDVKRLTRLIDDISNATRFEAEMAMASAAPVDLKVLLVTVRDMFNDLWRERDRSVRVQFSSPGLADGAYLVSGHEPRLAQVLTNIVDNALSFSPVGGVVAIDGKRVGDMWRIEISDTGPGIPDVALYNIFERFYTDRPGGEDSFGNNSGLGLSIARDIIEAHRGQLWAENVAAAADDKSTIPPTPAGARFIIELPVADGGARGRRGAQA